MRNILLVIIVTFAFGGCNAPSDETSENDANINASSFPKLEEVLTYLDNKISFGCKDCLFKIAKKPEGYYLTIQSQDSDEQLDEFIIWDVANNQYQPLKGVDQYVQNKDVYFPSESSDDYVKQMIEQYDLSGFKSMMNRASYYDFHLYFGYDEWPFDIIDALEDKPSKSLEELEMLARAYDMISGEYTHPGQLGDSPLKGKYKETFYEKIEAERVDGMISKAEKSLSYYQQIIDKDPNYETLIIGNVRLKQANNCVHYYTALNSVKEKDKALSFLERADYPDQYVEFAKSILDDCAVNGFLFTNGDNDTFPIWYVQEVLGYRKDVAVLNLSLMSSLSYLKLFQDQHQLKTNISLEKFTSSKSLFLLTNKESPYTISSQELVQVLNQQVLSGEQDYTKFDRVSPSVSIAFKNSNLIFEQKGSVFTLGDIALIDFIENNPEKTPNFASEYTLKNYGLGDFYSRKVISAQLVGNTDTLFYDASTIKRISETVASYSVSKAQSLENLAYWQMVNWMHLVDYLLDKNDPRGNSIATQIDQNLPDSEIAKVGNWNLLNIKLLIKKRLSNENLAVEFEKINNSALDALNQIEISVDNVKEVLTLFQDINSVYKTLESYIVESASNKDADVVGYNMTLSKLDEKIDQILELPEMEMHKWTQKSFESIQSQLSYR